MKNGYWKWLIGGLAKFFIAFVRCLPNAIFKVIPGLFISFFKWILEAFDEDEFWETVFAISGSILIVGLFLGGLLLPVILEHPESIKYFQCGVVFLLLTSSYAWFQEMPE